MSRRGDKHPLWKGGRRKTPQGYVQVWTEEGYRMEHHLVMEEHLGRRLLPHEEVHHKHGIRDDNRIEQLELWTTSQPHGQRVEDKTAWAAAFLREYGYTVYSHYGERL